MAAEEEGLVRRPAMGPGDWLLKRLGFEAWVTIVDGEHGEEERFNLRVPGWVARRPRLLDRIERVAVKVIRDIDADDKRERGEG